MVVDLCVVFFDYGLDQIGVEFHIALDNFQSAVIDLSSSDVQFLFFFRFLRNIFLFVIRVENAGDLFIVRELLRQSHLELFSVYLLH